MMHSTLRRGLGVLLVIVALGAGELGPIRLWNLFIEIFLADEVAAPPSDGSETGGDASQGGGAMDPNGDPKPTPTPIPPPNP